MKEFIRYRIPTWREDYYIYRDGDTFYNEMGTEVLIRGWEHQIHLFVPFK